MTEPLDTPAFILSLAIDASFLLILGALILAFIRLAKGPSLPDRVVALDLITVLAVAFAALLAVSANEPGFLDVAIALALVAFLATVAFARFAERRAANGNTTPQERKEP